MANPIFNKLKSDLKKANPDLTPSELDELAISEWNRVHPSNPMKLTVKQEEAVQETAKEPSFSAEDVKKMMSEMEERMQKKFDAKLKEFAKESTPTSTVENDIDDYVEIGVTFFSYMLQKIIFGYTKRGKYLKPPISDRIHLRNIASYRSRIPGQRDEKVIQMCAYTSYSKKEIDYLRNSPEFGIQLFEKMKDTVSVDAMLADRMMQVQNRVMSMNQHEVIQACKAENIPISTDFDPMKLALVRRMAEKQMIEEQTNLQRQIEAKEMDAR